MLKNNKCILVYNLKDEELQKLKRLPFKVIEITKEMASMTVKDIIEGLEVETETANENSPEEKMILFNNFAQREDVYKRQVFNIEKLRSVFLKSLYIKLKGGLNNESKAYT